MRIASLLIPFVALAASMAQPQGARGAPLPTPTPSSARPIPRPVVVLPIKLEDQWTTALVQRDPARSTVCWRPTSSIRKTLR